MSKIKENIPIPVLALSFDVVYREPFLWYEKDNTYSIMLLWGLNKTVHGVQRGGRYTGNTDEDEGSTQLESINGKKSQIQEYLK